MSRRMSPEEIFKCADEMAGSWLKSATEGTPDQLNNQIEILVQASIMVLGTNLGNAWKSLNWDQAMTARYIQMIANGVLGHARDLIDGIEKGDVEFVEAKIEQ